MKNLLKLGELKTRRLTKLNNKIMNRKPVISSNIASIGYDEASETLEIEFKNGGIYQYFDVPERIYKDIMGTGSKGEYLAQNIKGHYRYSKV